MVTTELIDSIRSLLDGRSASMAAEVVALEYARLCREVNERLGKIALMLEGGGEIQALQLAEQAPRVVDAALALSFGGESSWREYCRNHGHEVARIIDARTLESLFAIQAKGLAPNHHLYKEYRAAVSSRDDQRAHELIRIIARLNPGDENAANELKRLKRKTMQAALSSLRANLAGGDEDLLVAMEQVEEAGMAEDYQQLPEWQEALAVRERMRRIAARVRMPEALCHAEEQLEQGQWRQAAALHGEYTVLEASYGLGEEQTLVAEKARLIGVELARHRAAAERDARTRTLIVEMERIAGEVETRAATPLRLTSDVAGTLVGDLTRMLKQFGDQGGEIPDQTHRRVESARAWLIELLERRNRSKRRRLVLGVVVAAVVLLAAAAAGWLAFRASGRADLLDSLRARQSASGVRNLIERIRNDEPLLLRFPRLSAEFAQASRWLEAMDADVSLVNRELTALEEARRDGFAEMLSPDLCHKLEETAELASKLPADLAAETSSRMALVRNDGERVLKKRQEENDLQAREIATRWSGVMEKINLKGPAADAGQDLESASREIAPFQKLASHDATILRLPAATETMVAQADVLVRQMQERFDAASGALADLAAAETSASYREAVTRLADCGFSEGVAARAIVEAWPDEEGVKALLVFRGNLAALKAATNDPEGIAPVPDRVDEKDKDKEVVSALVSSEPLNCWVVEWKNSKGVVQSCLSLGKLVKVPNQGMAGKLAPYPKLTSEVLKFKDWIIATHEVVVANDPTPTAALMSRLDLPHLLDSDGVKFKASVLPLLDWVANDTAAKPLAKAYVWGQLIQLIKNHKPEEWGLHYCPSLIDEMRAFEDLKLKTPLAETAWLVEKTPDYAKTWEKYFAARGIRSSFNELAKTHAAAAKVLQGSVDLAGHVAADGSIVLKPASANRLLMAVCDLGEGVHALQVCGIAEARSADFTPLPMASPLSPLLSIQLPDDLQTFLLSIHRNGQANRPKPNQ